MESIFLILSGVILVAGVLYWLWSHIQLTQKKVQLLENAVFELRGMLANSGERSGGGPGTDDGQYAQRSGVPVPPSSPTRHVQIAAQAGGGGASGGDNTVNVVRAPAAEEDEDDDGWGPESVPVLTPNAGERVSVPLDALPALETHELTVEDDLQPGGRSAPSIAALAAEEEERQTDDFRRLFAVQEVVEVSATTPAPVAPSPTRTISSVTTGTAAVIRTPESLESMPVKELRRLAEQRGIAGASDMRKKEIISALRQQVSVNMTLPAPGNEAGEIKEVSFETAAPTTEAIVETDTAEILE
jgi:hypothetical protein